MPEQPDLLFLLHDLARSLRLEADRRARAHGMTRAQWSILMRVERQPGLSQKELAERIEVEPISVARLIDRLAERGMLERRGDPADRRIWRLHLCPPALPVLADIRVARAEMLGILGAGLAPSTIETVKSNLSHMKSNVQRGRAERPVREVA